MNIIKSLKTVTATLLLLSGFSIANSAFAQPQSLRNASEYNLQSGVALRTHLRRMVRLRHGFWKQISGEDPRK